MGGMLCVEWEYRVMAEEVGMVFGVQQLLKVTKMMMEW
jgi:hypothetical protein